MSVKKKIVAVNVNVSLPNAALYGTFQSHDGTPSGFLYVNSNGMNFGGNVTTFKQDADGKLTVQMMGLITKGRTRSVGSGLVITTPQVGKLPLIDATVYDANGKVLFDSGIATPNPNGFVSVTNL